MSISVTLKNLKQRFFCLVKTVTLIHQENSSVKSKFQFRFWFRLLGLGLGS